MIKTCPQCGEQFATLNGRKIFCCAKCQNEFNNDARKQRQPVYKKICPQCGKEFETTSRRKKYCNMTCTEKFHHSHAKQPAVIVDWTELETPPELLVVRCYNCGHEFKQTFPNEKFCSDDCRLDFFKLNDVANFFGKFSYLYQLQLEA